MKKNKKAFTLIELLGVIVILGIIALVVTPPIINNVKKSDEAIQNSNLNYIYSTGESYIKDNSNSYPMNEGAQICIKIEDLVNDGRFKEGTLEDGNIDSNKYILYTISENRKIDYELNLYNDEKCEKFAKATLVAGLITSNSIGVSMDVVSKETNLSYEFSIDGGNTWSTKSSNNQYTFTNLTRGTEYQIIGRVTNTKNEFITTSITLRTLDIDMPVYSSVPDLSISSNKKVITIHYPERQSNFIYEYSLDAGKTWLEVPTGTKKDVTFTKNGTITARIRDGYNVVTANTLTITNIDGTKPKVPTSVIRYDNSSGKEKENNQDWVRDNLWWGDFKSSDEGLGVDHYEYSDGCTGSKTGNLQSSYIYSSDMNKKYCIRAVDKAGNASDWSEPYYFKIDKTKPTCGTINLSGPAGNNGWYKGTVTVTKSDGSDALSGHASTTVSTGAISGDTKGTSVTLTTKDRAGNTCTTSKTVKIDGTKPTCGTIKLSGTTGNNGWYRSLVTVGKTDGSDATSGHASTTVSTSSVGDTNGTTVTLTTKDNAGNVCTTTSGTIKVDTRAPQNITVYVQSSSSYYNQTNVTVNVPYSSSFCTAGSKYGLSSYKASDGGSSITFYHNYSSSTRCPNGTAFTGCRRGETHTRKAFSPTSVIPDYFAGTAGYHSGYYTGYATGVYTIWAEDAAGNRSNEAKITMNFCTR